jgi:hypothetical protein
MSANMKLTLVCCLLSVVASAQVTVTKLDKNDPATGIKIATVLLTVKGDKPYNDDPAAAPAEFAIMCQETSLGKQKKQDVSLTLGTGVVPRTGYPQADPTLLADLGLIGTIVRLDGEQQPRQLVWEQTPGVPGILTRSDFKFVRDHILKSKSIHIEVASAGKETKVSSFDLSALREEYGKHPECKK